MTNSTKRSMIRSLDLCHALSDIFQTITLSHHHYLIWTTNHWRLLWSCMACTPYLHALGPSFCPSLDKKNTQGIHVDVYLRRSETHFESQTGLIYSLFHMHFCKDKKGWKWVYYPRLFLDSCTFMTLKAFWES